MFNSLDALNGGKASSLTTDSVPQKRERGFSPGGALVLDNCVSELRVLDKAPGDRNEVPGVRDLIARPGLGPPVQLGVQ